MRPIADDLSVTAADRSLPHETSVPGAESEICAPTKRRPFEPADSTLALASVAGAERPELALGDARPSGSRGPS